MWMAQALFALILGMTGAMKIMLPPPSLDLAAGMAAPAAIHRSDPEGDITLALAIDPSDPETLYAGGNGVFKTTDGGKSWTAIDSDLAELNATITLVIDPKDPATLYAGTSYGSVFKTADGGARWTTVSGGIRLAR